MNDVTTAIRKHGLRWCVNPERFNVAGLVWTYQCTIACRHCLFACRPERPHVVMGKEDCLTYLQAFHRVPRVIHLAGGECTIFYDEMLALCRAAQREGVPPHFIESNSSWCADDAVVRRRFEELRDAGVLGVLLSCDPYHQEFVPAERVRRSYRIGVEVFGAANVIGSAPDESRGAALERMAHDEEALREHVRAHPPQWVTGNAYHHLARYLDKRPIEAFEAERCTDLFDIDRTWEFHFDPYGNLQTNCGIVLGNARRTPPAELLTQANLDANPIVQVVCKAGPVGLLRMAIERGLEPRDGYVAKCELCYHARLHLRSCFPDVLCPDEVYAAR